MKAGEQLALEVTPFKNEVHFETKDDYLNIFVIEAGEGSEIFISKEQGTELFFWLKDVLEMNGKD